MLSFVPKLVGQVIIPATSQQGALLLPKHTVHICVITHLYFKAKSIIIIQTSYQFIVLNYFSARMKILKKADGFIISILMHFINIVLNIGQLCSREQIDVGFVF